MVGEKLIEIAQKASRETTRIALFETFADWVRWFRLRSSATALIGDRRARGQSLTVRFRDRLPLMMRLGTTDCLVAQEIFIDGEYDFLATLSLPEKPVVIDLGANIGAFLHFATPRWPGARLIAVEPDVGNLAMLRRNAHWVPGITKGDIVRACIGGQRGFTSLLPNWGEWAISMGEVSDAGEVPVMTMLDLCRDRGVDQIDLLKCDIEGAERQVFADCGAWIHRVRNLVVELHEPYRLADLLADLRRNGSSLKVVDQSRGKSTFLLQPGPSS